MLGDIRTYTIHWLPFLLSIVGQLVFLPVTGHAENYSATLTGGNVYPSGLYEPDCPDEDPRTHFSHESRLINCLLARYEHVTVLARPVRDSSRHVRVDFGLSLIQILDFDEIKQIITTSMWKTYVWIDHVLQWDPSKFGDVTHIRLPANRIWTPDIVLYNNADEQVKQHEELAAVFFNGTIKWIPPAIYRSSCEIDMRDFPFDEQTCVFKFGSWTYDQHKVDLRPWDNATEVDLREFVPSSEWRVINTTARLHIKRYPFFADDRYPELIFSLRLRRHSTFYIYLLVLPCILLSALTLTLFWIPPQRPDRTAVGMSLFSSFFILLLILVQSSPPTSASISRLGIHYCLNMVLIAVSTMLSVFVINMGQRGGPGTRLPSWMPKGALTKLGSLLCIHTPLTLSAPQPMSRETALDKQNYYECIHLNATSDVNGQSTCPPPRGRHVEPPITWVTVAAIFDRFFFIVYLLIIVISTVLIFPR